MSAAGRIAAFAGLLIAVFAVASLAGAALNPEVDETSAEHEEAQTMGGHAPDATEGTLPGLAVAQGGYRLVPERTSFAPGADRSFRFRIAAAAGETVRDFDVEHERRMHLIVVRRDFTEFQHLHPRQLADGSWEIDADLRRGGAYRAFADFATAGESLTLGTDLFVSGRFEPAELPPPSRTADAGGGYEVALAAAAPTSGGVSPVRFTVSRDGSEVASVQPYLGADGHLVALREHDQAYLHTHPEGAPGGPGPIEFGVEYPSPGRYRLFLQFKHRGHVRTAAFTQEVAGDAAQATEGEDDGGH